MSAPDIDLEGLNDGLSSPFWAWFKSYAEREWGAGGERYQLAVQTAAEKNDPDSVAMLRMVIFAKKEIDRLMKAPDEERARLRHASGPEHVVAGSRRGPGL